MDRTLVPSQVLTAAVALEVPHAEVHHPNIIVLAAKVRVAGHGIHLKDAMLNGQQRNVKLNTLRSPLPLLSKPEAMAAAVGSLMMRGTFIPEIVPASFVAWRCKSLK